MGEEEGAAGESGGEKGAADTVLKVARVLLDMRSKICAWREKIILYLAVEGGILLLYFSLDLSSTFSDRGENCETRFITLRLGDACKSLSPGGRNYLRS